MNNAVRFAWWGGNELGSLCSQGYVASLSFEEQLNIALYLDAHALGSSNAGYFVLDGDDSDSIGTGPGPFGSQQIEALLDGYLNTRRVAPAGADLPGTGDAAAFLAMGIPAGGTTAGTTAIKTAAQAAKWRGTAGGPFDPCYHRRCDSRARPVIRQISHPPARFLWSSD